MSVPGNPRETANSYSPESFRDPVAEMNRLTFRARARLDELIPSLRRLGLGRDSAVLDVGCGSGVRSIEIAKFVHAGTVLGIDSSKIMLSEARRMADVSGVTNISFNECNISTDQLTGTYDVVHIRLVVQHLPDPEMVLVKCREALKPGGSIFIEDTDRDWMVLYPAPTSWQKAYERIKDIQKEKGGDPFSGRKLASYLGRAGFRNVETKLVPVTGGAALIDEWLENYAPTYFTNLPEEEASSLMRSLDDIRQMRQDNPMFFHQIWFQATGYR